MLAVKVEATATPLLLVVAVVVAVPLAKVPLAPLDGAVNMTVTFGTKFPDASLTVTCRDIAKADVPAADCALPAVAASEAGAPAPPFPLPLSPPPLPPPLVQPRRKMQATAMEKASPFGTHLCRKV
jgi:hypothetical protein